MFRTAPRKYQCIFDDGRQYDLELALKKDKFTFVWIDPNRAERFTATGNLEKKNNMNYVLWPLKMMHSRNVGSDTEKETDMIVEKDGLEPYTCRVGNGFYNIPAKESEWTVEFENDKMETVKLKYRHWPSCTTKGMRLTECNAEIGTYSPGEMSEMTIWYTKSKS